jgi:RNase P subunit RPR2
MKKKKIKGASLPPLRIRIGSSVAMKRTNCSACNEFGEIYYSTKTAEGVPVYFCKSCTELSLENSNRRRLDDEDQPIEQRWHLD